MPHSLAIISTIIQTIPQPIVIVDKAGRIVLANSCAREGPELDEGQLLPEHIVTPAHADHFFELCQSTTVPVPARLKLRSGFDSVAFGHRLSVPDTGVDGVVMIRFDENMNLSSKFAALNDDISALTRKVQHIGRKNTQLESLAMTDPLTSVYNRRGFDLELEKEFSRSRRYGHSFCVTLMDLDRFKFFNDTHGHQLGDAVLVHFAHRCLEHLRQTDAISRVGGEEFAVILTETSLSPAVVVVNRMLDLINSTPLYAKGERYPYTASAGLAELRDDDTPESLYQRADRHLYSAKNNGRAQLVHDLFGHLPGTDRNDSQEQKLPT